MYTSMTSALSLFLLALIPATIAAPPPSSSSSSSSSVSSTTTAAPPPSSSVASSTIPSVQPPTETGKSCNKKDAVPPVFPVPAAAGKTCKTEGVKACTDDETSVLVCTSGNWVATDCGSKDGYHMACRSYANLIMTGGCPSYGPVYTECTGYEDMAVPESVTSEVGWDAQATSSATQPTSLATQPTSLATKPKSSATKPKSSATTTKSSSTKPTATPTNA